RLSLRGIVSALVSACHVHPQSALSAPLALIMQRGRPILERPRAKNMSGDVLLSHAVARAVPSAQKGLTSGFGMWPGVSPSPWPPKRYGDINLFPIVSREPHSGR